MARLSREYQERELRAPSREVDFKQYLKRSQSVRDRFRSPNNILEASFDWSLERHSSVSRYKEFQLKRQFCVRPVTR